MEQKRIATMSPLEKAPDLKYDVSNVSQLLTSVSDISFWEYYTMRGTDHTQRDVTIQILWVVITIWEHYTLGGTGTYTNDRANANDKNTT